jgi:hypothetical protein
MATYSHGYEENLKRAIRDAIAIDPIAGIHQLTETLSKRLDHSFDPRYIKRLRDKVIRQNLVELDRAQIEDRIAGTRENYRLVSGGAHKDHVVDGGERRARSSQAARKGPRGSG